MSSRPPTAGSAPEQRGDNGNDVWQPTTVQGTLTPAHGHSASAYGGPATARGRQKALKKTTTKEISGTYTETTIDKNGFVSNRGLEN